MEFLLKCKDVKACGYFEHAVCFSLSKPIKINDGEEAACNNLSVIEYLIWRKIELKMKCLIWPTWDHGLDSSIPYMEVLYLW